MGMWYSVDTGQELPAQPAEVDYTSSPDYVYVRRDFVLIDATDSVPAHWSWREMRIPRDMWEVSLLSMPLIRMLNEIFSALGELAILLEGDEEAYSTGEKLLRMSPVFLRLVDSGQMRLEEVPEAWREEVRMLMDARAKKDLTPQTDAGTKV